MPRCKTSTPPATKFSLGRVTFEIDRVEHHYGDEYVYFWMSTSGIRKNGDDHIENAGRSILVTREAWDAMASAATTTSSAAIELALRSQF